MAKLYPPVIEGTIPAFYGDEIIVPYSMNKSVNKDEIAGFSLKIKTVQNNLYLGTLEESSFTSNEVRFPINNLKLNIGQYYKVQMAYIYKNSDGSRGETGYYSTVGVVKCTSKPDVSIVGLKTGERNAHLYSYLGHYKQDIDYTEKVYSYNFKIWDINSNLIADSGELLHAYSNDDSSNESTDEFVITQELTQSTSYYIQYTITTNNKMKISSPRYRIAQKQSVLPEMEAELITELNFENGYVNVSLKGKIENGYEKITSGAFLLSRRKESEAGKWEEMLRFNLQGKKPSSWSWKDFTIEQGVSYIYSIQQYSDKLFSQRILSQPITADFEHAFLFDGVKQLKIKFNPKVSSFKTTLLESKTDTLGSKHPFIFRSGAVAYKEFPISGLISYLIDEENLFMDEQDYIFSENLYRNDLKTFKASRKTVNLTGDNIQLERRFKLAVLDWLNNGEPKLFRSPTEGNYIVRLMNSSLAPTDTVGRMLHTFSSTAYEVANYNYETLSSFGFIDGSAPEEKEVRTVISWASVELLPYLNNSGSLFTENLLIDNRQALDIDLTGLLPGDQVQITYADGNQNIIVIGATGSYKATNISPITSIQLNSNNAKVNGILTYSYETVYSNTFGLYRDATTQEIPAKQIFGTNYSIETNIIKEIEDIKTSILTMYYIQAEKRPVQAIFADAGQDIIVSDAQVDISLSNLYYDKYKTMPVLEDNIDPYMMYQIHLSALDNSIKVEKNQDYYIDAEFDKYFPKHGAYLDGLTGKIIAEENYSTKIFIDNSYEKEELGIELNEILFYRLEDIKPKELYIGSGILLTLGYNTSFVEYNFEDNSEYTEAVNKYKTDLEELGKGNTDITAAVLEEDIAAIKQSYERLIATLEIQLEEYKKEHGLDE